jgi:hypothetical protein
MRRPSFACVLGALGCVSPALRAQPGSVGDTQIAGDRVPAWSIGAGTGIVAIPAAG